ncbi:hypothetical protein SEA_WENTWORTH_25 [Streptomyces phage Wentworth]|nr:hypothetical protein SEA_WENTWORTH_25 [Streptomyces phage Wentworth]
MRKRAGMRIAADMMNDNSIDEQTSSGLQLEDDFSFLSFRGEKVNGVTSLSITLEYVGSGITATAEGNIGDAIVGFLPEGWWPPEQITSYFGKSDDSDGSFTVQTTGRILLKTMNNNAVLDSGQLVFLAVMWISENN